MPATYATLAQGYIAAPDGYRYRFDVDGAGATVDAPLPVRVLGCTLRWSVEGGGIAAATPLSPLMPCEASLRVEDPSRGGLARLTDSADGEIRLRVLRDVNKDDTFTDVLFVGPLNNVGASVNPFTPSYGGAPFSVSFTDGFGLLTGDYAVFNPTGATPPPPEETVQAALQAILFPLLGATYNGSGWDFPGGALQGIRMASQWYPWLGAGASQIPDTRNPLRAIYLRARSFVDEDGDAVTQLEALKQLCARFGLRALQSGGKVWLIQRELMATNPASVPYWGSGPGESGMKVTADLQADARAANTAYDYATSEGPALGLTPPVGKTRSTYDYQPDTLNYVLNGSFEGVGQPTGEDTGALTDARYWDLTNGGAWTTNKPRRVNLAAFVEPLNPPFNPGGIYNPSAYDLRNESFQPETGDSFALLVPNYVSGTNTERFGRQRGWSYVPPNAQASYRFDATALLFKPVGQGVSTHPKARLTLRESDGRTWGLYAARVDIQSRAFGGNGAVVQTAKALSDVLVGVPYGAILGRPGDTFRVYRDPTGRGRNNTGELSDPQPNGTGDSLNGRAVAEITLTKAYRTGDTALSGDVSMLDGFKTVNPAYDPLGTADYTADYLQVYYWAPLSDGDWLSTIPDETPPDEWPFRFGISASGVDVEGKAVSGFLDLSLRSARVGSTAQPSYTFWDGVAFGGSDAGSITYAASLPEGTRGQVADLPIGTGALLLGDGPTAESDSRLRASADLGITIRDTVRGNGQLTAWRSSPWGSDVPNREETIDGHSAISGLRQLGGQVETWGGIILAPSDGTLALYPHQAPLVNQFQTILQDAAAGTSTIYTAYAPPVGLPVTLSCRSSALAETRTVTDVQPYGKGYAVTLNAPLVNDHSASDPTQNGLLYSLRIWPDVFEHVIADASGNSGYTVQGTRLVFGPDATAYPDDALIIGGEPVLIGGEPVYI